MPDAPQPSVSVDAGARHEQALAELGVRKEQGSYYTPADVVGAVLDLALEPVLLARAGDAAALRSVRVIDPACGSGNFLAAAAVRLMAALAGSGVPPGEAARHVAAHGVWGIDLDPRALQLAREAVAEVLVVAPGEVARLVCGDALLEADLAPEGGFDVVVGNPPFLSQLGRRTARTADAAGRLRARFGDAVAAYTDPAAAFAVLGLHLARPAGGVVALVEPISFLTARDAAGARGALVAQAALTDLWVVGDRVFDAAVEVCVPVVVRGSRSERTVLHRGRDRATAATVTSPGPASSSWAHLLADLHGLPEREVQADGVLGDLAVATADFRDQFYGLAPHTVDRAEADDASHPRLVTSGLIDPAALRWGERPTRFNKVRYQHPRVEVAALPAALQAWAALRQVPKVLLATQTRVLEAVVDEAGALLPSVPVITITPLGDDPVDLWRIAAVLTCPAVTLVAARRHLGSGRNARSMRLRAQEVLALPLPADRAAWDDAAARLRAGAPVAEVGAAMDAAYGLADDAELLGWWRERLPAP